MGYHEKKNRRDVGRLIMSFNRNGSYPHDITEFERSKYDKLCVFCMEACLTDPCTMSKEDRPGVMLKLPVKKRMNSYKVGKKQHEVRCCMDCFKDLNREVLGQYILRDVYNNTVFNKDRKPVRQGQILHVVGGTFEGKCMYCGDDTNETVRNYFPRGAFNLIFTPAFICHECQEAIIEIEEDHPAYNHTYHKITCDWCEEVFPVTAEEKRALEKYGQDQPVVCDDCVITHLNASSPINRLRSIKCANCSELLTFDMGSTPINLENHNLLCKKCKGEKDKKEDIQDLKQETEECIAVYRKGKTPIHLYIGDRLVLEQEGTYDDNTLLNTHMFNNNRDLLDVLLSLYEQHKAYFVSIVNEDVWK